MSKSCCFAFVFAVICLSLEADAQPTVDETMTCGSSTSSDVEHLFTIIASNQRDIAEEIRDVKQVLASDSEETNETRLEDVVKEIKDVKKLIASKPTVSVTVEPSKQALVSALVCERLVYLQFDNTGSMQSSLNDFYATRAACSQVNNSFTQRLSASTEKASRAFIVILSIHFIHSMYMCILQHRTAILTLTFTTDCYQL